MGKRRRGVGDPLALSYHSADYHRDRTQEYAAVGGVDDDGDIFYPPLHRVNQVIRHRAIYDGEDIPSILPVLLKYSEPPGDLLNKCRPVLEDLIETANVKKGTAKFSIALHSRVNSSLVPEKAKGKASAKRDNKPKPISGLDVDALLKTDSKRKNIDPRNAIPEFKQMVQNADDIPGVEEAVKQMGGIVRSIVTDSLGDNGYDRAIEHIGVMREQMIAMEEPSLFNAFIRDFKKRLLQGDLGGNRRELWYMIRGVKLGLIDSKASESSEVTPAEATEVSKTSQPHIVDISFR